VEDNPVRACLCEQPAHWEWSSAAEAEGRAPACLVDWELRGRLLDAATAGEAACSCDDIETIRLHTRTGRPLGTEAFVQEVETAVGRCLRPRKRGRKPKNES